MPLAEVHVTLKPALFDAPGETIKKALHQLGYTSVQNVRIGKYITVEVEANGENGADPALLPAQLDRMCQQLLANPVIEDYEITLPGDVPDAALIENPSPAPRSDATAAAMTSPSVPTPATAHVAASVAQTSEAVSTPGGLTDPFQVDFRSYQAMPTEAKIALRTLALRKYGNWIERQLRDQNAAWVLCLGQEVTRAGASLDSYPSDQELLRLGIDRNRVPWVFTKPQD